ncbi:MAG TPA: ABC transporter permease, partial [Thermoanaerobaculia bacterium]
IPKGFGDRAISFGPAPRPELILLADTSDPVAPQLAAGMLQKVAMTALTGDMMSAGFETFEKWSGGFTGEQRSSVSTEIQNVEKLSHGDTGGGRTLVDVKTRDVMGETKANPTIAFYAAGLGVMFLLFTASGSGGALLEEIESGTLDRILSTRVTMTTLLLGKLAYLSLVAIVQLTLMFLWGALVFDVELFSHLAGFGVMTVITALAVGTFALLLATLCRTRGQLSAISTLLILLFSALGGSMFPRFLMPESIQKISLALFNSWALEGFLKVFWREESLLGLWPQVLVLGAHAVVFFLVARRVARRWEVV